MFFLCQFQVMQGFERQPAPIPTTSSSKGPTGKSAGPAAPVGAPPAAAAAVASAAAAKTTTPAGTSPPTGAEEMPPVHLNLNLVKNLLDSYAAQHGEAGPVSNLLGSLGIHGLPMNSNTPATGSKP